MERSFIGLCLPLTLFSVALLVIVAQFGSTSALLWALVGLSLLNSLYVYYLAYRYQRSLSGLSAMIAAIGTQESPPMAVPLSSEMRPVTIQALDRSAALTEMIQSFEKKLEEKNKILLSMIEGLITVDGNGIIQTVNPAIYDFLKPVGSPIGRYFHDVIRHSDFYSLYQLVRQTNHTQQRELSIQNRLCLVNAVPFMSDHLLFVIHDITRLRSLETAQTHFVSNVSHELKTPLTLILGYLETLQLDPAMPDTDRQHCLSIISTHVNRLSTLIQDLLSLAQLESTDLTDEKDGFITGSLAHVYESAIDAVRPLATKKKMTLLLSPPSPDWQVRIWQRSSFLEQAITNLVYNAIAYSSSPSRIWIQTNQTDEGGYVIAITDEGIGIAPRDLPRLGERFYRVDTSRSRNSGGTGLGLSLVKHIMAIHSGRMEIQSQLGKGTTVRLFLPHL